MKNPNGSALNVDSLLPEDGMQIVIATINILEEQKTLSLLLSIYRIEQILFP
jgi:hypothetical protein